MRELIKNLHTVAFLTLGCKVNQYDTQAMREIFLENGFKETGFDEVADVYVINTCTVTGNGDKKSISALRRAYKLNPDSEIVVAGCMAQRTPDHFRTFPGVRLVLGTQRRGEVVELLQYAIQQNVNLIAATDLKEMKYEELEVSSNEGHTRAVLKIQEGCNRFCSYCIIPYVRGQIHSRPIENIYNEACRLAENGYQEIVVTGIHLTSYGAEMNPRKRLSDAIDAIHKVPNVKRIRLGSLEPVIITDEFLEALRNMPKVCRQFHLALQSGSDAVLSRMRRRYTTDEYFTACQKLRKVFPECAITTDIITGFPGETEEEFIETFEFCKKIGFAKMHVFPYSERSGTVAASMNHSIPKAVRQERAKRLIALGNELRQSAEYSMIGKTENVLVEEIEKNSAIGYTSTYFRCMINTESEDCLLPGMMIPVKITGCSLDSLESVPYKEGDNG